MQVDRVVGCPRGVDPEAGSLGWFKWWMCGLTIDGCEMQRCRDAGVSGDIPGASDLLRMQNRRRWNQRGSAVSER
jgi:hypothetical protein